MVNRVVSPWILSIVALVAAAQPSLAQGAATAGQACAVDQRSPSEADPVLKSLKFADRLEQYQATLVADPKAAQRRKGSSER